ncbi:MAG TPA: hypothetical protein VKR53_09075 [Puia sp.]|nr:hypothetical protein [Puia sp.]
MEENKTHPYIYALKYLPAELRDEVERSYKELLHKELLKALMESDFKKIHDICLSLQILTDNPDEWSKFKTSDKA